MKMTNEDLVEYLESQGCRFNFDKDKNIVVRSFVPFEHVKKHFTSLPENVIFNTPCNLDGSPFSTIPDSTKFMFSLFLNNKIKTLPTLALYNITMRQSVNLSFGTMIYGNIYCDFGYYATMEGVHINGYTVTSGVLS